jgi:hypothetical protein
MMQSRNIENFEGEKNTSNCSDFGMKKWDWKVISNIKVKKIESDEKSLKIKIGVTMNE